MKQAMMMILFAGSTLMLGGCAPVEQETQATPEDVASCPEEAVPEAVGSAEQGLSLCPGGSYYACKRSVCDHKKGLPHMFCIITCREACPHEPMK